MDDRVAMLGADGEPLGWTYEAARYDLVAAAVREAVDVLAGPDGTILLKDVVAAVQDRLGTHERFPSGRLTNATRYVVADLRGRGELVRVPGSGAQRLRRAAG